MSETLPIVYLARHGETAWTISGQYTGLTDLPLTERGERNARSSFTAAPVIKKSARIWRLCARHGVCWDRPASRRESKAACSINRTKSQARREGEHCSRKEDENNGNFNEGN
jgi:hypothetical protein